MTDDEQKLLTALAWMCEQYMGTGHASYLDHQAMSAGEEAVELLVQYGLVEPTGRGGSWTEAGRKVLDSR